jgi:hypothetical protein
MRVARRSCLPPAKALAKIVGFDGDAGDGVVCDGACERAGLEQVA